MKTRIAVETPTAVHWGGGFQYAATVIKALGELDRDRYEVQVWHHDTSWEPFLQKLGIPGRRHGVFEVPPHLMRPFTALRDAANAGALSRETLAAVAGELQPYICANSIAHYRPHVVIFPQMATGTFVPGARHVGVIHDLMHRYEPQFPEVSAEDETWRREIMFTRTIGACDAILVDSAVGARHVLESYPHAKESQLRVLPYTPSEELLCAAPRKPKIAVPEKFFVYPAQFWMHKNHVRLARAVARLAKEIPDIHVVAAGGQNQNGFESFLQVVEATGIERNFTLPGYVADDELAWYYKNARGLVMPTFFGPTNIPPLEAMALGCPAAVSGIYGMPEMYGDGALYFDPNSVSDIAETMRKLWMGDALRETLRQKGLAQAEKYNFKVFSRCVHEIVETLPA